VSQIFARIGSPCLRHGVHGASIGDRSRQLEAALELCTEACEGYRDALGSGARPTLGAVFELGLTRLRCDDYEAAEQLLQEAVDGHKLVAGPHSAATVRWVRGHARGLCPLTVDRRPSTVDRCPPCDGGPAPNGHDGCVAAAGWGGGLSSACVHVTEMYLCNVCSCHRKIGM
jgi:hypothetical protein